ncbi:MAG: ribosome assembly cofactor RimP [Spirochaetales bacterium]|nr:ribosome assembly cofactor RimP [Spirochaetales bacterium]
MQRAAEAIESEIGKEIEPIVNAMGLHLVELTISFMKRSCSVIIVIHKTGGVTVADCSAVAKNLQPRLELHEELKDFQLQVASPGISRMLKSRREYSIFKGRGLSVLRTGNSEWTNGILREVADEHIVLGGPENAEKIPFAGIKKAKLITLEGEN